MSADVADGRSESVPSRPVVTLAALCGGSVVGPRVAERLGVEFLDRGRYVDKSRAVGVLGKCALSRAIWR